MPVAEGYEYADIPHALTIDSGRYGCNGEAQWPGWQLVQDGWTPDGRRNMVTIAVEPVRVACGHDVRTSDSKCSGCPRRRRQ